MQNYMQKRDVSDITENIWCKEVGLEPTDRLIKDLFLKNNSLNSVPMWDKTKKIISYMDDFTARKNISFVIVLIPDIVQVDSEKRGIIEKCYNLSDEDVDYDRPNQKLIDFLVENKIAYIDLTPELKAAILKKNLYIPDDIHFNKEGHKIIADRLFLWLLNNLENGKK
jgi:hypothetical protein